jgi:hypothetical protein
VNFRGDFKPELVQLLMRLRLKEGQQAPGDLSPLTAEQLRELMEKSVEISIGAQAEADLASTIGLFLTNLEKEAGTPIPDEKLELQDGTPVDGGGEEEGELPQEAKSFYYDEWDFRAADYKPGWCCVRERPLDEGELRFFEEALEEHAALVAETRRHAAPRAVPQDQAALRRRGVRPRSGDRLPRREEGRASPHRQGVLAPQQGRTRRGGGVPARHECVDGRGDREAQTEVPR